jgi:hypothetical protein
MRACRKVVDDPVHPRPLRRLGIGRVRILDDECKGHCKLSTTGTSKGSGFCVDPLDADGDCELTSWCKAGLECTSGKCTAPGPDTRLAATCTP